MKCEPCAMSRDVKTNEEKNQAIKSNKVNYHHHNNNLMDAGNFFFANISKEKIKQKIWTHRETKPEETATETNNTESKLFSIKALLQSNFH